MTFSCMKKYGFSNKILCIFMAVDFCTFALHYAVYDKFYLSFARFLQIM